MTSALQPRPFEDGLTLLCHHAIRGNGGIYRKREKAARFRRAHYFLPRTLNVVTVAARRICFIRWRLIRSLAKVQYHLPRLITMLSVTEVRSPSGLPQFYAMTRVHCQAYPARKQH
jgi:hypothetical protein